MYYNDLPYTEPGETPSESGKEVHSLSGRPGDQLQQGKYAFSLFAGVDNVPDQRYSLGYDVNAAAGRYYNAAPGRIIEIVLNR